MIALGKFRPKASFLAVLIAQALGLLVLGCVLPEIGGLLFFAGIVFFVCASCSWALFRLADIGGLTEGSKVAASLRTKGYRWASASDLRALSLRNDWGYAWTCKLPSRDEVAVTPIYRGDNVESLAACAKILLHRERAKKS